MIFTIVCRSAMKREIFIAAIYLITTHFTEVILLSDSVEFCENEPFNASCPQPDQVLLINKAEYGVVLLGRCITKDYGHTGCSVEVTDYLNLKCAGRRKCEFSQPDPYLSEVNKCGLEFKVHMIVHYECIKVDRAACRTCSGSSKAELSNPSGYISSVVTYETMNDHSCGSSRCPWVVAVQPGQVVNISFFDFSSHPSRGGVAGVRSRQRNSDTCPKSMIIKERSNPRDVVVCHGSSGKVGKVHVYTSVSNTVEIQVVSSEAFSSIHHFLIQYEAIGCPDIVPPKNSWVQRKVDKFEIGCASSDTALWELTCVGVEWKGVIGSCDGDGPLMGGVLSGIPKAASSLIGFVSSLPFGILLAGVIATATILSVCILTVGYVCYKRSHHSQYRRHPQSVDQYMDINDPNCSLVQKVMSGKTLGGKGKGYNFSTAGRENKYAANHQGRMMMMGGGQMPSGGATGGVRPLPSIPDLRGTGAATVHRAGGMGGTVVQPPRMMIRSYGEGGAIGVKQRPDSMGYPQQMVGGPRMGEQQQHEYFVIEERNRADVSTDDSDSFPPPPDLLFPADSRQGSLMRPPNQQPQPPPLQQFNPGSTTYRPPMTLSSALKQNTNTYENQQAILGTLATAGITAAAGGLALAKHAASEVEQSGVNISAPLDI